ncbi:MAG: hypothetical protein ACYTDY_05590, partial [Planctomycetota bacterium]
MSDTAIESAEAQAPIDIRAILESRDPDLEELHRLRLLAMTERDVRQEVDEFMQELPATLADAGRATALIRTKGYAWFVVGEANLAAEWLSKVTDVPRAR